MRPGASPASPSSTALDVLDALDAAVGTQAVPGQVPGSDRGPDSFLATTHGLSSEYA